MDFRKRLDNFWYHYKLPVIMAALALASVIYNNVQQQPAAAPSFTVGIIDTAVHDSDRCAQLQRVLEANSSSTVEVRTYCLLLGAPDQDYDTVVRLEEDLANTTSGLLLIEDPEAFRENVSYAADAVMEGQVKDTSLAGCGFDELYVYFTPGSAQAYRCLLGQ